MFFLLPIIAFVFLFLNLYDKRKKYWRSSFLLSSLVWAVSLTAITEVLSLFKLLSFGWLLGIWILICTLQGFLYQYSVKTRKPGDKDNRRKKDQELNNSVEQEHLSPSLSIRVWLLGILFIITLVGLVALIAPPNTNDSMGYHMPRVMHWIQNHSVSHYPTNYTAQLFLSPWSTFAILHFQILSGGDRYANLVQWFSMIGSIIGVSLIAKQLGANRYGQAFASVFCATLPMGILQGSSTQNDYVVAFWLVCLVYYILRSLQDKTGKKYVLEIGLSLGLATFAKPTAYLYSFPFLLWLLIVKLKLLRWRIYKPAFQVAVLVFVVNGFHWIRNLELFHHPLGKSPDYIIYTNRALNIPIFLSNIIRNIALHLSTPSPSINRWLLNGLSTIHSILGVDINDPRTSSSNFQLNSLINHEDFAGNALHLLLFIISIICFIKVRRKKALNSPLCKYVFCIITGFSLFCLLLAWTPFHTRLHLSLCVLSSAFVGCVLSRYWSLRLIKFVAIILLISSLPWIFFNESRPLIANSNFIKNGIIENIFNTSRRDLYFMGRRYFKEPMIGATNFIKSQQCSNIGISFDKLNIYEYPLWVLLKADTDKPYQIQHMGLNNVSAAKQRLHPFKNFNPCIIFDSSGTILEKMPEQQDNYVKKWFLSPVSVFIKTKN